MGREESTLPTIRDFRPFIMCGPDNYETTKSFYTDIGFQKLWDDESSACEFATGFAEQRFLVTLHLNIELPRGGMMHFWVDDAQAWYDYLMGLGLDRSYPMVVITPPVITDWGWFITYVADPSGLKLHFAEPHSDEVKAFFRAAPWIGD